MRRALLVPLAVALALAPAAGLAGHGPTTLLDVDDGDFFYITPVPPAGQTCTVGNTHSPTNAQAIRHWHVGVPFAPASAEPAGGFGCLGGPKTWTVTVASGHTAAVTGRIRYTWDTNVPGGCCNDVHLHAFDASGALVASTLLDDGPGPIVPVVLPVREHAIDFTLGAGTYTLMEDIFSGEHTGWLTRLRVVES